MGQEGMFLSIIYEKNKTCDWKYLHNFLGQGKDSNTDSITGEIYIGSNLNSKTFHKYQLLCIWGNLHKVKVIGTQIKCDLS
jgi:hypothetical protein